jgi:L-alanine-DL-glutamate epimerase-like enolase superfamily enzyme
MNWDLSITNQYLIEDPVLEPLNIKNGKVFIEETIGLGTEIDMNKAKKYITQN